MEMNELAEQAIQFVSLTNLNPAYNVPLYDPP